MSRNRSVNSFPIDPRRPPDWTLEEGSSSPAQVRPAIDPLVLEVGKRLLRVGGRQGRVGKAALVITRVHAAA